MVISEARCYLPLSLTPKQSQVVLPDRALGTAYETLSELSRREIAQG